MNTDRSRSEWEQIFEEYLGGLATGDAAHGDDHIKRVVKNAKKLAVIEQADLDIVIPAAWLHDCVAVPKSSPQRSQASKMCADKATDLLAQWEYQSDLIPAIAHAIHAHSFSARVEPKTVEAKVLQDADRLDAIGAIGLSRCLMLGGEMKKPLINAADPFCENREPDDSIYVLDHLYNKLFKLEGMMQTAAGLAEAKHRSAILRRFVDDLRAEVL
jgi:uncharacterized protein